MPRLRKSQPGQARVRDCLRLRASRAARLTRMLRALAPAILLFLLVAAPRASADLPTRFDFFGLDTFGGLREASEVADISEFGVHNERIQINWGTIQREGCDTEVPRRLSFEETDSWVANAARANITIIPYLYATCLGRRFPRPGTGLYTNFIRPEGFVDQVVRRYGYGGSFWREHPEGERNGVPAHPMHVFEVWNEPNQYQNNPDYNEATNRRALQPQAYAKLLIDTSNTIKTAQSALDGSGTRHPPEILMGGLAPSTQPREFGSVNCGRRVPPALRDAPHCYLRRMYREIPPAESPEHYTARELHEAFDGMAYHPYQLRHRAGRVILELLMARRSLDRDSPDHLDASKSIWVTESGWGQVEIPAEDIGRREELPAWLITEARQAEYLRGVFNWMYLHAISLNIRYASWFVYRDKPIERDERELAEGKRVGEPANNYCRELTAHGCWEEVAGLRRLDGTTRRAYCAYAMVIRPREPRCEYSVARRRVVANDPIIQPLNGNASRVTVEGRLIGDNEEEEGVSKGVNVSLSWWDAAHARWIEWVSVTAEAFDEEYSIPNVELPATGTWRARVISFAEGDYEYATSGDVTFEVSGASQLVAANSGKCLDVEGAVLVAHSFVVQNDCGDPNWTSSQVWELRLLGEYGQYQIVNRASGLCLDIQGREVEPGARAWLEECLGASATSQLWYRESADVGESSFWVGPVHSELCLTAREGSRLSGASLVQETCEEPEPELPDQRWSFRTVETTGTPARLEASPSPAVVRPSQSSVTITIRNVGEWSIESEAGLVHAPFSASVPSECLRLHPGDSCSFSVDASGLRRPASDLLTIGYRAFGREYSLTDAVRVLATEPVWGLTASLPHGSEAANGISCTASTACTSVGSHRDITAAAAGAFAERWNGTSWAVQTTPSPTGASESRLQAVSCASSTACTAVGSYVERSGVTRTLAERWNGTTWSVQISADPVGARSSVLNGVACASTSACTAVGSYVDSSGVTRTLAESWNGTTWSLLSPNAPGRSSQFLGVACPEAESCVAVGDYVEASGTTKSLVERHTLLTAWETQTSVDPSGSTSTSLKGISCVRASDCTAVGTYTERSGVGKTLAEHWSGRAWSTLTTPNPSGARASTVTAVSCPRASACSAVGSYETEGRTLNLAEVWNGREWTIQTSPNQTGSRSNSFTSVSCSGATTTCKAGSNYTKASGSGRAIYHPEAGAWTADTIGKSTDSLSGIACVSATACIATGGERRPETTLTKPFVARWDGSAWTREEVAMPRSVEVAALPAISCPSTTFCVAAGYVTTPAGIGLIENWNGREWTIQSFPVPTNTTSTRFGGISCRATNDCVAFGSYVTRESTRGFISERWDGVRWTLETITTVPGATSLSPEGLSCASSDGFCAAVGYYSTTAGTFAFLAQSNGFGWTVQTVPSNERRILQGASCISSSMCAAVGYDSTQASLIMRWDGSEWTTDTAPRPEGVPLRSVSCTSSTSCTATGTGSSNTLTRAEQWDGTEWTVQTTPSPEVAPGELTFLATCISSIECVAIGSSFPSDSYAEVYS
jgi:hypothetical protein